MRKPLLPLLFFMVYSFFAFSQSSDFVVQVAAFDTKVGLDYFKGLTNVYHIEDHNNIHKYYISGFTDKAAAETSAGQARNLGYNAYVIDMVAVRNSCALACGMAPAPPRLRPIFFDFDQSSLRPESKRQLKQLRDLLIKYPEYTVELSAHTDAKGSFEYNEALSLRRANVTKDYLMANGIPSTRIKISTFGENAPIAKNELDNGRDTPEGRQFNRRVVPIIHLPDGKVEPVVEEIQVPTNLRT